MGDSAIVRLTQALSGRYAIGREIGAGGMATVYLAHDVKHARQVAIKVLHPDLAAGLGSERFLTEIRVTANLQHPHILPLLDSGDADGFYYFVMPFVVGETLRQRLLKGGALPVPDAVRILVEVVDALAAAHAVGVVHRDIKPENIMVSGRHALVTDFGVAKAITDATGSNRTTTQGVALGTPAYMAPEQAAAGPHIDHRVDIYAVGVLGYELLCGSPPFGGRTNQEILSAHVTQPPEPLMARRPSCPSELAAVIMKCLEKRPADRYQDAEELLAELEQQLTPSGGMTPTRTRPLPAIRRARPHSIAWVVGALLLTGGLSGVGLWLYRRTVASRPLVLRDRVQLTFTGQISNAAISPDGAALAYAVTECKAGTCHYDVEVKDVRGAATQRLLRGATAINGIRWSPDRRNLLVAASIDGQYANFLVSALGGTPRPVSTGPLAIWAGDDSLWTIPPSRPDSTHVVWASGLDGVARDSIRVAGSWERSALVGTIAGSRWIVVSRNLVWPHVEFSTIDRRGTIGGRVTLTPAGSARLSDDALWAMIGQAGVNTTPHIVRVAVDAETGHFSSRIDTISSGLFANFDVTRDGRKLVLHEGTAQYAVWALDLGTAFRGTFPESRKLMQSSTSLSALISGNGERVAVWRDDAAAVGGDQVTVRPFVGGPVTSVARSGIAGIHGAAVLDTNMLVLRLHTAAGPQLVPADARNGTRRLPFTVPDSAMEAFAPLASDGWVWIPSSLKSIRFQQRGDSAVRTFRIPDWYVGAHSIVASPDGRQVAFAGIDSTNQRFGVSVMSLSDGRVTQWLALFAENVAAYRWLPDGSILITVEEQAGFTTLYRLRGPGQRERLGTFGRSVSDFSLANDLRRVAIVTRDYNGDAWMATVVRPQ